MVIRDINRGALFREEKPKETDRDYAGTTKIITADHCVVGVADSLFRNMPSQTWRWAK